MDNSAANRILNLTRELRWQIGEDFHESLAEGIYADASEIAGHAVRRDTEKKKLRFDQKIDRIVTSGTWGFPIMFLLLGVVLWMTITGANYPSAMLAELLLEKVHPFLKGVVPFIARIHHSHDVQGEQVGVDLQPAAFAVRHRIDLVR